LLGERGQDAFLSVGFVGDSLGLGVVCSAVGVWAARILVEYLAVFSSKPRGLGRDLGYRVVVDSVWVRLHLNPHPLTAEGAHPKSTEMVEIATKQD
jgi:hypothetical protein